MFYCIIPTCKSKGLFLSKIELVGCKIKIKKFYQIEFCCSLCRVDDLFIYPAVPGGDINARL